MNGGWKWLEKWNIPAFYKGYRALKHSEYFDPEWYLARNPDVRAAGWNPIMHYLLRGDCEGRKPSTRFDGAVYRKLNPDVARSGMNSLVHYELFGRAEGRSFFLEDTTELERECRAVLDRYRGYGGVLQHRETSEKEWRPATVQPFFSVVMPTRNRVDCIGRAIDSLLAQTYSRFELLICDDGSTDQTGALIEKTYSDALAQGRIRYQRIAHAGCAAARNRALESAAGEWIAYLDSDNIIHEDFLITFAAHISEYPEKKLFYAQARRMKAQTVIGGCFDPARLRTANYIDLGTVVHSRALSRRLGGFDETLTRLIDWELLLRYCEHEVPVFLPFILMDYNDDDGMARISNDIDYRANARKITSRWGMRR